MAAPPPYPTGACQAPEPYLTTEARVAAAQDEPVALAMVAGVCARFQCSVGDLFESLPDEDRRSA
jgi:hypothetical protein